MALDHFTSNTGRSCDGCSMCCYILAIEDLKKPMGTWCTNCSSKKGCDIYPNHPQECKDYQCGYLIHDKLFGEIWNPVKSKMVVTPGLNGKRLRVNVHPSYPSRWKEEPYYSQLRRIAQNLDPKSMQLLICVGRRTTAMLPNEDVYLGHVAEDEEVWTNVTKTQFGFKVTAKKIAKDPTA